MSLWDTIKESPLNPLNWLETGYNIYEQRQERGSAEHWNRQNLEWSKQQFQDQLNLAINRDMQQNQQWRKSFQFAKDQAQVQQEFAREQWQNRIPNVVNQARKAGISPLVAMGVSPVPGPSMSFGPSPRSGGGMPGSSIPSARGAYGRSIDMFGAMQRRISIALAQEELAQQRIRTKGMAQSVNKIPDTVVEQTEGTTHGVHGTWKIHQRPGNRFTLENIERREPEEALLAWMQTEGKKLTMGMRGVYYKLMSQKQQKRLRMYVHRQRAILNDLRPLPKGQMYKWDLSDASFIVGPADGKIFAQQPLSFGRKKPVYMNEFMTGQPPRKGKKTWKDVPFHKIRR